MFFIIPVGHESSTVRRQPWISYIIIVLNALIFLFFTHSALDKRETREYLRDILNYAVEHPYTELDPEIEAIVPGEVLDQFEKARVELREIVPEPYRDDLDLEQAHLDELSDKFLAVYRKDSYRQWGYIPSRKGQIHTLLTNVFFHSGFMHLLGNMFIFFLCGPFIEDRWGRAIFTSFYLVSGIVSSLAHGLLTDTPDIPLVGASGAIAGVMGAFLILFFHTKIRFLYIIIFIFRIFKGHFLAPAFVVLPLWFGQQYYNAVTAVNSSVAFWAHVGGFVFGAGMALIMKFSKIEERYISPVIEGKITVYEAHPLLEKALQLRGEDQNQQAIQILKHILKETPNDISALNALLEIHTEARDAGGMQENGSRLIAAFLKKNQLDEALEVYDNMKIDQQYIYPRPEVIFNLATSMENAQRDDGLKTYEELIHAYPKHFLALKSLVKLAKYHIESSQNYKQAFSYFVLAKYHPEIDQHLATQIEAGIRRSREKGDQDLAQMREEDVEGLEIYKETSRERMVQLETGSTQLIGLSPKGIKLKDKEGRQHDLQWPGIILLSAAVVKKPSRSPGKAERNVILIDVFDRKIEDENRLHYAGFRLSSDQIPIHKLFKGNPPATKAYGALMNFLQSHISCPSAPSADALKRLKLPRYDSPKEYEDSLCKQLHSLSEKHAAA